MERGASGQGVADKEVAEFWSKMEAKAEQCELFERCTPHACDGAKNI